MALTKTQINYLENKLDRVVAEKIAEYKKQADSNDSFSMFVFKSIQNGKAKLLSNSDLLKVIKEQVNNTTYYYSQTSIAVENMIEPKQREKLSKEYDEKKAKSEDFSNRIRKAERQALDRIVLEGIDVETALAELDKIK